MIYKRLLFLNTMFATFFAASMTFPLQVSASSENVSKSSDGTDYIEVSSPTEISDILAEDGSMVTEQEAESDSVYATKRIILMGVDADTEIYAGLDASQVVSYPEYEEVILSFDTESATKAAYKKLLSVYGEDKCFLDEVISSDDVLFEEDTSDTSEETGISVEKYTATSWGVEAMAMDQLKSSYTADDSNDVTVAVLDTGINQDNAMFSGRKISGYNVMTNSDDYSDIVTAKNGHGTHVCGIIADATPSNVDLLVIGVFDADGNSAYSSVITAFQYALEHGADVINMSAGYSPSDSTTLSFLDEVIHDAYEEGVPVVTALGNKHKLATNVYPASNEETIAVSGLKQSSDESSSLSFDSSYSNYGSLTDFSAPGTDIVSAANASGTAYAMKNGTSMASPHIAAAFAWLKLFYPAESTSELYTHLMQYCVDLGDSGKDIYYGNGCPILTNLLTDASYKSSADTTEATTESTETTEAATTGTTEQTKTATTGTTEQTKATTTATTEQTKSSTTTKKKTVAKPKSTKITLAKRKACRSIRLRWKKVSGVNGYQICYSTSKSFRKKNHYVTVKGASKNSRLIRKLKRHRTFYVRVRTYKIVKGKKVYSGWSNVRKVKTK